MTASEKDTLVKLLPRRFVPDSELTNVGGNDYETSFIPKKPSAVYQAISFNTFNSLSFSYNAATGVTTITTGVAPNENIFADYPLYLSTKTVVDTFDNPVDETGGTVSWLPRIISNPQISQSAKDLLQGVLTVSSSSLRVINEDFEYNNFLTTYDNYFNAEFNAYVRIGTTYYRLSNGVIASVKAGKVLIFQLKSQNKLFDTTATLGNVTKYWKSTLGDFSNLAVKNDGKPIKHSVGFASIIPENDGIDSNNIPTIDITALDQGRFVDNSTNRFLLGTIHNARTIDDLISCSEVSRFTDGDGDNLTEISVASSDIKYFFPGLRLAGKYNTGTDWSGFQVKTVSYVLNRIYIDAQPGGVTFAQLYLGPAWVWINGFAKMPVDFTGTPDKLVAETTTSGDTLIYYEQKGAVISSWENYDVRFILLANSSEDQTDFAQRLIESTGLSINTAEFSAAQTEANNQLVMSMPITGENKLETVGYYLQRIAASNNGLFYVDDQTQEVGYKIINTNLSGVDFTVTSTEILEPELIPIIEYQDTYSSISITNPSYLNFTYISGISYTEDSTFSKFFNKREKSLQEDNYNENVIGAGAERIDRAKQPAYFYDFTVKSDNYFTIQLGDIVKIEDVENKLVSNQTSTELVVVSLKKSSENIEVRGYEFSRIS